ncbi:MAG: PDDEXK family nuclease [Candidatus Hecatellaceae archaeon]
MREKTNYNNTNSYFMIAVSTRENLELCLKYSLAGFPSNKNGAWAYSEIQENDRVSFLYGARVHNLYVVRNKLCLENDDSELPGWKPLEFGYGKKLGRYTFPFRLELEPLRKFDEPLTRVEFSYVAENLLLRGGYRKSHFQADRTDLGHASRLGSIAEDHAQWPSYTNPFFEPRFTFNKSLVNEPKVFLFWEQLLQAAIRRYLCNKKKLEDFLKALTIDLLYADELEVLGEKSLPRGYVDILIKEAIPTGISRKIIIEVKRGNATAKSFEQLEAYKQELGKECIAAVLIAQKINEKLKRKFQSIKAVEYHIGSLPNTFTFPELVKAINLHVFSAR